MSTQKALRERYARQVNNPHLKRLGGWRMENTESKHDDAAYKANLVATAGAIHNKTEKALENL